MNQQPSNALPRLRLAIARETKEVSKIIRPRLFLWALCARILPENALCLLRRSFYRLAGCNISRAVTLLGRLTLLGSGDIPRRLRIGEGSIIAHGVIFGLDGEITIGCNVSISPYVKLYTATHNLGYGSRRMGFGVKPRPICIENGVWIGIDSLILPGVTLGQGCVVSAGAVVTADVPANTLVSGNPAVVQKQLPFGDR
jgi:maltose O-acetyltransferase